METIALGQIDLSFHHASAGIYVYLLNHFGYEVAVKSAKHEAMFDQFVAGEVELLLSAWLPGSHSKYLKDFDAYEKLSAIYEPYCIWGVPEYVPETTVSTIQDLADPLVASKFNKLIQGINEGAGISRFSREIVTKYGLDKQGFHFENGNLEDCIGTFLHAEKAKEWAVIPLWHPQYIHHQLKIRELKDPENLLRGRDEATTIIRKDSALFANKELMQLLKKIYLGNEVISEIDYYINVEKLTALQATEKWVKKAFGNIDRYIHHLKNH
ncbi:hypothetical protein BKI52_01835 [marine bacterium AO1-C]|nr:hypothetical protein BKI52_01835 [marine bacterium AO1-C]